MKNSVLKRLFVYGALGCFGLSVAFSPVATINASAAVPEVAEPRADVKTWVPGVLYGNQLHERLYNCSTADWEGDWVYIRTLTDEEVEYLKRVKPSIFIDNP